MSSLIRKVISTAKAPAAIGPYRYRRPLGAEKDAGSVGSEVVGSEVGGLGQSGSELRRVFGVHRATSYNMLNPETEPGKAGSPPRDPLCVIKLSILYLKL